MLCFLALKRGDASLMTPIMKLKTYFCGFICHNIEPYTKQSNSLNLDSSCPRNPFNRLISWPSTKADFSPHGILLAVIGAAGFGLLTRSFLFYKPLGSFFLLFIYLVLLVYFQFCLSRGRKGLYSLPKNIRFVDVVISYPMGGQAVCMSMAIGFYQIPTQANIFYAGRGFWSVILVALIGGWLGLKEGKSSQPILLRRMIGALLLLVGVWLISN